MDESPSSPWVYTAADIKARADALADALAELRGSVERYTSGVELSPDEVLCDLDTLRQYAGALADVLEGNNGP